MKPNIITSIVFITFIKNYSGEYTDFLNIKSWLESSWKFKKCTTISELKTRMQKDAYFNDRHFAKLDDAQTFYFANRHLFD